MARDPYRSPYPLLRDTVRAMEEAQQADADFDHHDEGSGYFWPSSASIQITRNKNGRILTEIEGTCIRRSWYRTQGYKETDRGSQRMFDVTAFGSALEDIYKDRFHAVPGYRVIYPDIRGRKRRFRNQTTRVSGELDMLIQHIETTTLFGVDIKSYDGAWNAIRLAGWDAAEAAYGKGSMPSIGKHPPGAYKKHGRNAPLNPLWVELHEAKPQPKADHLLQMMLYLEQFWDDGVKLFKIAYVARDRGPEAEFDISLTTENGKRHATVNGEIQPEYTVEGIHARFQILGKHLESGEPPPRDYVPEYDADFVLSDPYQQFSGTVKSKVKKGGVHRDWQCTFCPYLSQCLAESTQAPF